MRGRLDCPLFKKMKRHLLIVLLVSLTLISCSDQTSSDTEQDLDLVTFFSNHLEISGVAPAGWVEIFPGTFKRAENEQDFTVLLQRSYPQIDNDWLLESTLFMAASPLDELPDSSGTLQTECFQWNLYQVEISVASSSMVMELALAQTVTHSYVIVLLTDLNDHDFLREAAFLPAVEALKTVDNPAPSTIYDDNINLFSYDQSQPLDIEETQQSIVDGITEIQLTYASPKGGRVPATLLIPEGTGPFPGLVFMHGFPSNRHAIKPFAMEYARRNVAGIMIDAPWARPEHADRDYPLTFSEIDKDEQIQLIIDLSRAVDLFLQRSDIDSEQLVYLGISYGGAMGGLFAGVEKRLIAYVLVVGDGGLLNHFFGLEDVVFGDPEFNNAFIQQQWFEKMWPVEPLFYVSRASPAALLFQNGRSDMAVPPPDAIRYQLAGSSPKTIIWYEAGHNLSNQALTDQLNWLSQYITIRQETDSELPSRCSRKNSFVLLP
ncbi:alpha/beta hydrolase family protein [candidate division CSSED10-310 bacterium]|uniref:Alpha/beta hydrolase family protein n=1 Tax=candidate division CSSED10-310 bacterium TaxID=2855610 RepID=A0ABV6Z0I0_UNCC1